MTGRARPAGPMARIVQSVDFERVLAVRSRASTPHFAVHHVAAVATLPKPRTRKLSTNSGCLGAQAVDELLGEAHSPLDSWVGAVVPKRHARRAVTRSLLKRQIYAAAERHRARLAPGLWVVRLRSPFDRSVFPSAASEPLRRGARDELERLLEAAHEGARP